MSPPRSLIDELEAALQSGSISKRTELLRRITDFFIGESDRFSTEQVSVFDEVMGRIVVHIEAKVLSELSARLAPAANAPVGVIRRLAWDDDITVSGPVLQHSTKLTDEDLVEIAKNKPQDHLLKISGRQTVSEAVTDVLVDQGNSAVKNRIAANVGARFSEVGISKLVICGEVDESLLTTIVGRDDIPPLLLRHIFARATDTVRERLMTQVKPQMRDQIRKALGNISNQMRANNTPRQYAEAQQRIAAITQDTALAKAKLWEFATTRHFPEMVVTLSELCAVPVDLVDHLVNNAGHFGSVVLCRAIGLDWTVAEAIMRVRTEPHQDAPDMTELNQQYHQLSVPSAQRLLRFWQAQQDQVAVAERKTSSAAA